jgi:hypothetical protein
MSFGSNENRGRGQQRFKAIQGLLGLFRPDERVQLLEQSVEGHSPLAQSGDEPTEGGQTAGGPLHAFHVAYGAHLGDGRDFFRGWL